MNNEEEKIYQELLQKPLHYKTTFPITNKEELIFCSQKKNVTISIKVYITKVFDYPKYKKIFSVFFEKDKNFIETFL
jgi:hypothetical protein